jgi:chorismate mutase
MDRINRRLRKNLQDRARLALAIARWKRRRGLPLFDAAREREMLAGALARKRTGYSDAELSIIFGSVFRATRAMLRRELSDR